MIESSPLTSAGAHLAALADWLDLDGMFLITNDPFRGVTSPHGALSFSDAPIPDGPLRCAALAAKAVLAQKFRVSQKSTNPAHPQERSSRNHYAAVRR